MLTEVGHLTAPVASAATALGATLARSTGTDRFDADSVGCCSV